MDYNYVNSPLNFSELTLFNDCLNRTAFVLELWTRKSGNEIPETADVLASLYFANLLRLTPLAEEFPGDDLRKDRHGFAIAKTRT